jgi:hypothetical protein
MHETSLLSLAMPAIVSVCSKNQEGSKIEKQSDRDAWALTTELRQKQQKHTTAGIRQWSPT